MKNLLLILIFPLLATAQLPDRHVYLNASFDPNKAFNIIDNPRTKIDHTGLDFDLELGIEDRNWKMFIYYGRFQKIGYQSYGAGVSYVFQFTDHLDFTTGLAYGFIMRKATYYEEPTWMSMLGWNARATLIYWFGNLGATAKLQFQQRQDIATYGILEGTVGLVYQIEF